MYLNSNEKELISKEIEKLERFSSAELVAVITKRSANYKYTTAMISLLITIIVSFISIFVFDISTLKLLQIQMITFVGINLFLEKFDNLILLLLPKNYKRAQASHYANNQFLNLGLNRTKTNQAIMFFVSLDEKYVEIITDNTISEKIPNDYWEEIIKEFVNDVKLNNISNGYLKAIKSCSAILIENFPIKIDDKNELSNEVIEIESL